MRGAPDPGALSLAVVGLPRDVLDALAAVGLFTLSDFASRDPEEIVQIRGVGSGSVRRVRRWLELQGLDTMLSKRFVRSSGIAPKKSIAKLEAPGEAAILPVPEPLLDAPVPIHVIPARISNLLRRHGIRTLQELYRTLKGGVALEGFGVGTRWEVIESLPQIYAAAANAGKSFEVSCPEETVGEGLRRLRTMDGRPVPLLRLARELGLTIEEAALQVEKANDVIFIKPWCLTPDDRGLADAVSVCSPSEFGDELQRKIRQALSEREHQVLVRWIGMGQPCQRHGQIARELDRSRERIRQLRQRGLMKVSATPAVHGMLATMAKSAVKGSSRESVGANFDAVFEAKFTLLLGSDNAGAFARLCQRGPLNLIST